MRMGVKGYLAMLIVLVIVAAMSCSKDDQVAPTAPADQLESPATIEAQMVDGGSPDEVMNEENVGAAGMYVEDLGTRMAFALDGNADNSPLIEFEVEPDESEAETSDSENLISAKVKHYTLRWSVKTKRYAVWIGFASLDRSGWWWYYGRLIKDKRTHKYTLWGNPGERVCLVAWLYPSGTYYGRACTTFPTRLTTKSVKTTIR